MNSIDSFQKALDYIENNITESIDYKTVSRNACMSEYHFQRVFSVLCGCTVGEYIRSRRLYLAAIELRETGAKVLDVAVKYGYDSSESFSRAFQNFHGVNPSVVRNGSASIKSYNRMTVKVIIEGGVNMKYKIEKNEGLSITGVERHFTGNAADRLLQQHNMMTEGSVMYDRFALQAMAHDLDTEYCIISNFSDDGFDFLAGSKIPDYFAENLEKSIGTENAARIKTIKVPPQTYVVFETEKSALSINSHLDLRKEIFSSWLPFSGYTLKNTPEITVIHHYENDKDASFIELWLPIEENKTK